MKLPFGWRSGSSRCGDASIRSAPLQPSWKLPASSTRFAVKPSSHHEDTGTESPVTSTASPLSSLKGDVESKPVDMDQYCVIENDEAPPSTTENVEAGMLDHDNTAIKETEKTYTSALTKSMDTKQARVSNAMKDLLEEVFETLEEQGKQNENEVMRLKAKAAINLKKQERVTMQFVDLIQQLEQEAMKKEAINQNLQKRLQKANHLLESEGLSIVANSAVPSMSHNSRRGVRTMRPLQEMFAITEIFCSEKSEDVDDMTCQFSEAAHAVPDTKEPPLSPVTAKTAATSVNSMPLHSEQELLEF